MKKLISKKAKQTNHGTATKKGTQTDSPLNAGNVQELPSSEPREKGTPK